MSLRDIFLRPYKGGDGRGIPTVNPFKVDAGSAPTAVDAFSAGVASAQNGKVATGQMGFSDMRNRTREAFDKGPSAPPRRESRYDAEARDEGEARVIEIPDPYTPREVVVSDRPPNFGPVRSDGRRMP